MSVFLIIKIALFGCVYAEMLFLIQIATLKCKSIVLGILDTFLVWDNYSHFSDGILIICNNCPHIWWIKISQYNHMLKLLLAVWVQLGGSLLNHDTWLPL